MNTGMLWFDNDPKTGLAAKIERAAEYYAKKYGRKPNLCLVNPATLSGSGTRPNALAAEQEIPAITIRPYRPMLPGHLWIGVDDKTA